MTLITITGDVKLPDGTGPRGGSITYELDGNAKDGSGNKVVGRGRIRLPNGGDLDGMIPAPKIIATADLTPSTRRYTVTYRLLDDYGVSHVFSERWAVPASPSSQAISGLQV